MRTRRGTREDLARDVTRLSLLCEVTRSFSEIIDIDQLVPSVISRTKEILNAEGSAILLLDEATEELYFPYSADIAPEVERRFAAIRFPADRGIAGWVLRTGMAQLVPDVSKDERWYANVDPQSGMATRSLLCAPLRTRRATLGVIELRNKLDGEFTPEDLEFLDALASTVAVAIDNARSYRSLKESADKLRDEVGVLHREMASRSRFPEVVGNSEVMGRVFDLMESAITSPITVLLQGETGTGKELIARAIHCNGPRKERPFVAVNCGALAEGLLESELFGHRKGSFTGAIADKKGLFEVADGGTILLDEIAETTPGMQVQLLRVLESGEVLPVGGTEPHWVDVRIISATNRDLEQETKRGRFREDLFYRLSTFPITVPPLRARCDDIPLLAGYLLKRTKKKFGKSIQGFTAAALDHLTAYPWPGNVRELENEIGRAVALTRAGDMLGPANLSEKLIVKKPAHVPRGATPVTLRHARTVFEQEYLSEILRQKQGNVTQAAKVLGLSRVALQKKIKALGLRRDVWVPRR